MRGDILYLENEELEVITVDPIRGQFKVKRLNSEESEPFVCDAAILTTKEMTKPPQKPEKPRRSKQTKPPKVSTAELPPAATTNSETCPDETCPDDLDFLTYVLPSGTVLRIGTLTTIVNLESPVAIRRIFKRPSGSVFISAFLCTCNDVEVLSVLRDFEVCASSVNVDVVDLSKFSLTRVSSVLSSILSVAHKRVISCQEKNLGLVEYVRGLRCHSLGAQMRQSVIFSISVNASRTAQPATHLIPSTIR